VICRGRCLSGNFCNPAAEDGGYYSSIFAFEEIFASACGEFLFDQAMEPDRHR